jgi:hypothetical protein
VKRDFPSFILWLIFATVLSLFAPLPGECGGPVPPFLTESGAAAYLALKMSIDGSNAAPTVTFPGVVRAGTGTAAAPEWSFRGFPDSGVHATSTGAVQIFAGGGNAAFSVASDTKIVTIPEGLQQESWTEVSFQNSWVNYDGGTAFASASYMIDSCGFVHLKGNVKGGTPASAIFTLPAGYRPASKTWVPVVANDLFAILEIATTGVVSCPGGGAVYVSLEGVTFHAP